MRCSAILKRGVSMTSSGMRLLMVRAAPADLISAVWTLPIFSEIFSATCLAAAEEAVSAPHAGRKYPYLCADHL